MNFEGKENENSNLDIFNEKEKMKQEYKAKTEKLNDCKNPKKNKKPKKIFTKTEIEIADKRLQSNTICYYLISFYAGLSSITELAIAFHFKDVLKMEPAALTQLMSAITIPWSLKPLMGLLSDFCPIFGYKRKFYVILCGIVSMICWLNMANFGMANFQIKGMARPGWDTDF